MNKKRTDISVIVPCRNSRKMLPSLLEALKDQQEAAKEIIIVDNGSTDETYAFVRSYAQKYPQMNILLVQESKPGRSRARNKGIQMARGSLLAFTDSDCVPDRSWLKSITLFFSQHPEVDALGGIIRSYKPFSLAQKLKDAERASLSRKNTGKITNRIEMVISKFMDTANLALKKESLGNIIFDEDLVRAEDMAFNFQLFDRGLSLRVNVPEVLVYHVERETLGAYLSMIFQYRCSYAEIIKKTFPKRLLLLLPGIPPVNIPFPFTAFIGQQFFLLTAILVLSILFPLLSLFALLLYIIVVTAKVFFVSEAETALGSAFIISLVRIAQKILSEAGKITGSIRYDLMCL